MPSQSQACWRYVKANTRVRLSKCLFIYMKCARRQWNDWISPEQTLLLKKETKGTTCDAMSCGRLLRFIVSSWISCRLTWLTWHVSFIVFNSAIQPVVAPFSLSPTCLCRWHIETLLRVMLQVCLVTSLIQGWFYLFMPLFDFNNLMQWNVSFIQL